ncbi:hypothetical protein RRF57_008536 [Xylaria bambusicola]|uniref:Uncharacterized protein n=1 Tax=Xylaria bambusicola TaxID=326684 RepID=A0AAN7UTN4_9PEZI
MPDRRIVEDAVACLEDDVRAYRVADEKYIIVRLALLRAGRDAQAGYCFQDVLDLILQVVRLVLRGEWLMVFSYEASEVLAVDMKIGGGGEGGVGVEEVS